MLTTSFGGVIRQAREVRGLSSVDAARAASISPAYLSKLEKDAVKRPSPLVLHQLSEALGIAYADLMRLCGYLVPGDRDDSATTSVGAALFSDITDEERDELLEYLAWFRARRRTKRAALPAS